VFMLVFGAGAALAGLAGVIGGSTFVTEPAMAATVGSVIFVVVVVGGLGSLAGAFIAAMVLGMVQAMGAVYLPDAAVLLPFVLMVAILIWKPAGFAGSRT
jgi:branched-chain amino acid transport system permease protein